MKTVLCALHSQYIHSALAPWYLKAAAEAWCRLPQEVAVLEATVNQPEEEVLDRLLRERADVLAFSCYIWNITTVKSLIASLAERTPGVRILLGGPEAGFRAQELLEELPAVWGIQIGEGERSFAALLDRLAAGEAADGIDGLCYRKEGRIVLRPASRQTEDPPSPYTPDYLAALKGRIAYLETSRGCPFSCAFCLSGREETVRFFEMGRVKRDILLVANSGAQTVKLVDRTFNCRPDRAKALFRFLLEQRGRGIPEGVRFHFEVAADLFDEEAITLLNGAPRGFFQLEAGLQSFHRPTLEAVTRKTDLDRLCRNLRRLLAPGNLHMHIDLIAGLPYEDFSTFAQSFNRAYALHPHMLQLGFLKFLYGSRLRAQAAEWGYQFSADPPYACTQSRWLTEEELRRLAGIEDALERLYNSGRFRCTLAYLLKHTGWTPFDLLDKTASFLGEQGETAGVSLDDYTARVYRGFSSFPGVDPARLRDVMACDCLMSSRNGRLPPCLQVEDRRLGRLKRELAVREGKGTRRGVAILYSLGGRAVAADYTHPPDPITTRYALHWAVPAFGGDEARADPRG